jgi:hypothetical protein
MQLVCPALLTTRAHTHTFPNIDFQTDALTVADVQTFDRQLHTWQLPPQFARSNAGLRPGASMYADVIRSAESIKFFRGFPRSYSTRSVGTRTPVCASHAAPPPPTALLGLHSAAIRTQPWYRHRSTCVPRCTVKAISLPLLHVRLYSTPARVPAQPATVGTPRLLHFCVFPCNQCSLSHCSQAPKGSNAPQ